MITRLFVLLMMIPMFVQLDAMFTFATHMDKSRVVSLEDRLGRLSVNNPSNLQLKLYCKSLENNDVNETNCSQRIHDAQTLLFPLNTYITERFVQASEKNLPRASWWPSFNWITRPFHQGYNVTQEGIAIISDTQNSLRVSDYFWMSGGFLLADNLVRRVSHENSALGLIISPLYVAGPLAALWLKKCRFDMYQIAQNTVRDLDKKQREGINAFQIINERMEAERNDLQAHNNDLTRQYESTQEEMKRLRNETLRRVIHSKFQKINAPDEVAVRQTQQPQEQNYLENRREAKELPVDPLVQSIIKQAMQQNQYGLQNHAAAVVPTNIVAPPSSSMTVMSNVAKNHDEPEQQNMPSGYGSQAGMPHNIGSLLSARDAQKSFLLMRRILNNL